MKTTLNITISWSVFALMLVGAVATYQSADPPGNEPKLLITGGRRAISRRLSPPLRAGAPPGVQQFQQQSNTQPGSYNLPDVSATCSASDLVLRVKPTFYGLFADKEELKLGDNCESNGVLRPYGDLLFTYPLTACGAVRQPGARHIAYKFVLHYKPLVGSWPKVDVDIECRYPRNYHVSKLIIQPTWKTAVMHKRLKGLSKNFHIELMDDSWSKPISSRVYQLGSRINFQVSAFYLPKGAKVYISSCFAVPANDPGSSQKYIFIDNSGCLLDSKIAPGNSQFISQTDNTVRFSLTAFQFVAEPEVALKVQCHLLLTLEDPSPVHKSCTYRGSGWESLSGDDSICDCCESQCVTSKTRRALMKGSATSQVLMVSDQPSMKEDVSAIISTSSSMTSEGASASSHDMDGLQVRDKQGWTTVDLYDEEDQSTRYIRSDLDLDSHMGALLVENDKSTVTKAALFKDAESGYSFGGVISQGELEQFQDRDDDVSQPEKAQKLNWKNIEKSLLMEINQLREQRDSKEVKESGEHVGEERNGRKLNSQVQLRKDKELDRDGFMTSGESI